MLAGIMVVLVTGIIPAGMVKVTVNGEVERNPAYQVQPGDLIRFRDQPVRPEERRVYLLLNKPRDVISTVSDDRGLISQHPFGLAQLGAGQSR